MTTDRKAGDEPAFACASESGHQQGMTKREAFAMAALTGLLAANAMRKIADTGFQDEAIVQELARGTVQIADALISELERTKQP